MRSADAMYMDGFHDELKSFISRVKDRAKARIEKAMEEYEAVSRNYVLRGQGSQIGKHENLSA